MTPRELGKYHSRCKRLLQNNNLFYEILDQRGRPVEFSKLKASGVFHRFSSGEKVLVRLCYDAFNGSGQVTASDFQCLDQEHKKRALKFFKTLANGNTF